MLCLKKDKTKKILQMGAQISIITVPLHVSHHLLNPEEGGFREFKDEDISSKKRRKKPKPDMIVITS